MFRGRGASTAAGQDHRSAWCFRLATASRTKRVCRRSRHHHSRLGRIFVSAPIPTTSRASIRQACGCDRRRGPWSSIRTAAAAGSVSSCVGRSTIPGDKVRWRRNGRWSATCAGASGWTACGERARSGGFVRFGRIAFRSACSSCGTSAAGTRTAAAVSELLRTVSSNQCLCRRRRCPHRRSGCVLLGAPKQKERASDSQRALRSCSPCASRASWKS